MLTKKKRNRPKQKRRVRRVTPAKRAAKKKRREELRASATARLWRDVADTPSCIWPGDPFGI